MTVIDRIDPEYLPVLRACPIIDLADIAAARAALHQVFAMAGAQAPAADIVREDHLVPESAGRAAVRVRSYRPRGAVGPLPAVVWIQGGGYVLTAADPDDQWCERLASRHGCLVVSVLWRRAPEHPFPAAHEDCFATLGWLLDQHAVLGIDPDRVTVAGASSGGGAAGPPAHARAC